MINSNEPRMTYPDQDEPLFTAPPRDLRAEDGAVHLWKIWLNDVPPAVSCLLDAEERARAERFRSEHDRARFIAARGTLRHLLAGYMGMPADTLHFASGPYGKPELKHNSRPLKFNLSHCGDLMLLAVTYEREVGVDVEQVRDNLEYEMLIEQYFTPDDACQVQALPADERASAFFRLWTRAEACLKAAGTGIRDGLRVPDRERWTVRDFTPAPGYSASVAVERGNDCTLACWAWPQ